MPLHRVIGAARRRGTVPLYEMRLKLMDFSEYLSGNPAMLEIWSDAMERIDRNEELSPVQAVVVKEWLHMARSRVHRLELEAQRDMLSDESYAELAVLRIEITRMAGVV